MRRVHSIRLGTSRAHLIEAAEGWVMVDAGARGRARLFFQKLNGLRIEPRDIRLIVMTHAHYDHAGSLAAIAAGTGAAVAVHRAEAHLLMQGKMIVPPGTNLFGRTVSWLGRNLARGCLDFDPVRPDIVVDGALNLKDHGLDGQLIPTPGHTPGSMSLVLEDGRAFIGDAAVNFFPWFQGRYFPPFAHDPRQVLESWRLLLDLGLREFFPAHGPAFTASGLTRALERKEKSRFALAG